MGVILIAFERESEQSSLEQLLTSKGHRVMKAANGLTALDAARREPPDLIVSDIVLPRMDGFALCRKWKQDERLQSVPFIFYTRRHDDPKYERFALELGAERFLSRTVPPETLLAAVSELLATKPARANTSATQPLPALEETVIRKAVVKAHRDAQVQLNAQVENIKRELAASQEEQSRLRAQIDEAQSAQQRLAAGEARFRRVFEANPTPMWIADHATGGFIAVNEAALRLFGHARAEFLALKSANLLHPEDDHDESGGAVRKHQRKDGSPLALAVASHEIEFDGRSADLVSAFDLTERLAHERKLEEQAAGGRAILDAAADGCWVLDRDGRITDVNDAYCRVSGYAREQLIGMKAAEIEDSSSGEMTMRLQLGRGGGGERYETKHRRRDGSMLDVEVSIGLLGEAGSVVMIRDVSQRRRELIASRSALRRSEFLVELAAQSEALDESAIVRRVLEQATEALHSPLSFVYFVDATGESIALAAWQERGKPAVMADGGAHPLAHASLFTECVRAKRPTASNDPTPKSTDGLPELQRYLAAPMVSHDETIAVLGVANRGPSYTEEDQRALTALADGVQHVLSEKRAHARTLGALHRADVALQGMIDSFVRVNERHDPYTAGSARRLAALAVALGRESGLDGERQHALRIAALLHDVGNIAVPAAILAKPAPLTENELALMRTHVEEGCQLLADIDFGAPIADIVYQSHERYDGSGYPRGLKGEEILLEARILGLADTVEAMCSPRPYRPAAGMDAAMEEINRNAGRLYDPHLVAACTRLIRQHGFALPQ